MTTDEFARRELTDRARTAIAELDELALEIPQAIPSGALDHIADIRAGLAAGLEETGETP